MNARGTIASESDIDALHGEVESATLEIKGVHTDGKIKKTEKLVEAIQGFMNGSEEQAHIIIGIHENEKQEVDRAKKSPIRFPAKINGMDFEPDSFAAYRDHLMKMLRHATENYTEGLCKVDRIKTQDGEAEFIVITVSRSVLRPHRNTNGHYYIRRTEGRTERMATVEVETEFLQKEIRLGALRSAVSKKNEPPEQSFEDNPFGGDKAIAALVPFGDRDASREVRLMKGAEEYLLLVPSTKHEKKWTSGDLKELVYASPGLSPFGRVTSSWHERNEYGAVVFQESSVEPGTALNMSQVFFDGHLLGIDRFMLNADKLKEFSGLKHPYIPSQAFEEDFENGLRNFYRFMAETLKIATPFMFRAGLNGIRGYAMAVPRQYSKQIDGNMIKDKVEYDGTVGSLDSIQMALLPFFELVWAECGLKRPRNFRFSAPSA